MSSDDITLAKVKIICICCTYFFAGYFAEMLRKFVETSDLEFCSIYFILFTCVSSITYRN